MPREPPPADENRLVHGSSTGHALGHTILVIAYRHLAAGDVYRDLGVSYVDERDRQAGERRLVGRFDRLGDEVSLEPDA